MDDLPPVLVFFDVETTGLGEDDRIVSLGTIEAQTSSLRNGEPNAAFNHLIFNPERKSHSRAREVHGYSDALLKQQQRFVQYAPQIFPIFEQETIAIAHNAPFDGRFLDAELTRAGREPSLHLGCTLDMCRRAGFSPASLDAVSARLNIPKSTGHHSALEDAWIAMAVFCCLRGWPAPPPDERRLMTPVNLRE